MAIGLQGTAELIKPLEGAIIRRFTAGAAITAGHVIAMMADGAVDPADGSAFVGTQVIGVAIAAAAAAGDLVDVVTYGPISAITGGTPAAIVYISDTAGTVAETAGTKDTIVGYVESATVLFVRPRLIDLS